MTFEFLNPPHPYAMTRRTKELAGPNTTYTLWHYDVPIYRAKSYQESIQAMVAIAEVQRLTARLLR